MAQVRPGTAAFDLGKVGDSHPGVLEVVDRINVTKEDVAKNPGVDCTPIQNYVSYSAGREKQAREREQARRGFGRNQIDSRPMFCAASPATHHKDPSETRPRFTDKKEMSAPCSSLRLGGRKGKPLTELARDGELRVGSLEGEGRRPRAVAAVHVVARGAPLAGGGDLLEEGGSFGGRGLREREGSALALARERFARR